MDKKKNEAGREIRKEKAMVHTRNVTPFIGVCYNFFFDKLHGACL